jgi:hypothetical protein
VAGTRTGSAKMLDVPDEIQSTLEVHCTEMLASRETVAVTTGGPGMVKFEALG